MTSENDSEDQAENAELPEIDDSVVGEEEKQLEVSDSRSASDDLGLIMDVPLRLSVELGSANLPMCAMSWRSRKGLSSSWIAPTASPRTSTSMIV